MTYAELREALKVLGLGERATMAELRKRHRGLVKRYHPDSGHGGDGERIRQVNEAYGLVLRYLGDYRFSFAEDEFYEQNPEERMRRQFMADPLWGAGEGYDD
ncbi:MAG TPA: DnaJ domain-containing protein [Geobacteraceae bacterium]|nr:DnaJ domain-containing protein [Geobacteraceae bacterium]